MNMADCVQAEAAPRTLINDGIFGSWREGGTAAHDACGDQSVHSSRAVSRSGGVSEGSDRLQSARFLGAHSSAG